jgi:thioredoxin-like negative regulator of GroEL
MELLQLSTPWCPPCKAAKDYIEKTYDVDFLNYKYIDLNNLVDIDEKYLKVIRELSPKSVPLFVVLDEDLIIYTFRGFSREEIDNYAQFVAREGTTKVREVTSLKKAKANKAKQELADAERRLKQILESDEEEDSKIDPSDFDDDDPDDDLEKI